MAKHPHRLMLHQKKTWRCMLPGCRYFIHSGLEFTLAGQTSICWECGGEFVLDEGSIKDARSGDDMPVCYDCKNRRAGGPSADDVDDLINAQTALARAGVQYVRELSPNKRKNLEMMGINFSVLEQYENNQVEDQVEVFEPTIEHAPTCGLYEGGDCTCK